MLSHTESFEGCVAVSSVSAAALVALLLLLLLLMLMMQLLFIHPFPLMFLFHIGFLVIMSFAFLTLLPTKVSFELTQSRIRASWLDARFWMQAC